MKFATYAALIASTAAIRLQSAEPVTASSFMEPTLLSVEKHIPSPEEIWKNFDTNGDNQWNLQETMKAFKTGMKYFGHELPKDWKKGVKAHFKAADTDNSGKISPKEGLVFLYQLIDENDDGVITKKEVFDAIKALAKVTKNKLVKGWKQKVGAALEHVDTNNDDKITMKEAMEALEKYGFPDLNDLMVQTEGGKLKLSDLLEMTVEKKIPSPEEVWNHFDKNGDGELDLAEVKQGVKDTFAFFGHDLPADWESETEKHFKDTDTDNSGKVSPKEFGVWVFQMIDQDDDGFIQPQEFLDAIEWIAEKTGNRLKRNWKKKVQVVMQAVDANDDGKASKKEIYDALKKHGFPDINDLFE